MLTAYYSKGCDSRSLFDHFQISQAADYEQYLNKCDVIRFDVQWCASAAKAAGADLIGYLNQSIIELREDPVRALKKIHRGFIR